MLKRSLAALAVLAAVTALAGCSDDGSATDSAPTTAPSSASASSGGDEPTCPYLDKGGAAKEVELPPAEPTVSGEVPAELDTSIGTLSATLDADSTPCTVNSFVSLAGQGFFDDTTCHRLTTQGILVLQCGDPTATGTGGPGYSFADELSGDETYPAGTLAMANSGPDTNGSQFFIVYGDTPLQPNYTVFGTVDAAAVKLVAKAAKAGTDEANGPGDGKPKTPVDITSVTTG